MRRLITFCAVVVLIMATGNVHADMIDFESLDHGTVVYGQFSGAYFNGDARVIFSLVDSFPPLPGSSKVIENYLSYDIRFDSVDPEGWLMAGGFVTGTANVTLTAYGSHGEELGIPSFTDGDNTFNQYPPNPLPSNIFLSVSAASIDYVIFSIDSTKGYNFTVDNFTFNPVPVPAAVLLGMLGLSVAGLKLRKFV